MSRDSVAGKQTCCSCLLQTTTYPFSEVRHRDLIFPAAFPLTRRRLEQAGIAVISIDIAELQKAEGAMTCSSVVFAAVTVS